MKLRRLILLLSDEDKRPSDSALEGEYEPDWGLLTEVDRLRTTSSGLSAEVQRQTQIGQDYARAVSEKRLRVEELERENAIALSNCQMLERRPRRCLCSSPGCSRRAARGRRPPDPCRTRNAWVGTCEGRICGCACRAQTRTRAKCRKRFPRTRRRQRRSPLLHLGKSCRGREEEALAEHRSGAQRGRLDPQS
jgi:hypothetical protein